MSLVVGRVGLASSSTLASVVHACEVLLTYVAVGCVDGAAEFHGTSEAGLSTWGVVLGVAVRSSDHHLEISAVLALVRCRFRCDAGTPERTFDVGERSWVRAGLGWSEGGITLEVDVEARAGVGCVTQLLAFNCVVRLESVKTHVCIGTHGAL